MRSKEQQMSSDLLIATRFKASVSQLLPVLSVVALGLVFVVCATARAQGDGDKAPAPVAGIPILPVGSPAPDFTLPGIAGKPHSLKDYASNKVLAVVFTCNHCPVAQMYEKRIKQLYNDYKNRGVAVVVIMGNDPSDEKYSEWGFTDLGDSFTDMKERAAYRGLSYPYLYDGDTQTVTHKYGPTATPHIFVFDQQRILRYEGRIDSNPREELATKHEARDAIEALLAGKEVVVKDTPAMGCSTKWAFKEATAKAQSIADDQKQVSVDLISPEHLKTLIKNRSTDKLLLVNFWTTCGVP